MKIALPFFESLLEPLLNPASSKEASYLLPETEHGVIKCLAERAADVISLHAPDGTYRFVSAACLHTFGFAPEALKGQNVFAFCHLDDAAELRRAYRALAEGSTSETATYRLRRKDGSYIWLETKSSAIRDDGSALEGVVAVSREVTGRLTQQERIEQQAIRLGILREISLAILRAETSPAIAEAALGRLSSLVPYHSASVAKFDHEVGQAFPVAMAPIAAADAARPPAPLGQPVPLEEFGAVAPAGKPSFTNPKLTYVANLATTKDRSTLQEALYQWGVRSYIVLPLTVEGESPGALISLGALIVTRVESNAFASDDLSVLKEVAGLLAVALQQARSRKALITAKRKAEAAQKEAKEMSRLKSSLLANLSHEIRTPLTSILGFSEVLIEMVEGKPQELLQLIRQSGRRLLEMLTSTLELSELESGKRLRLETVDVRSVAKEVVRLMEPKALRKELPIRLEVPNSPAWARADRAALSRVLTHLVSNAVKFTEEGYVVVRIMSCDGAAAQETIAVEVKDTGIGIKPGYVPHLFDEFKQESEGLTRSYEGAGIGLSIARRFVELMEGRIEVESEEGAGSTFTVHVPASQRQESGHSSE